MPISIPRKRGQKTPVASSCWDTKHKQFYDKKFRFDYWEISSNTDVTKVKSKIMNMPFMVYFAFFLLKSARGGLNWAWDNQIQIKE